MKPTSKEEFLETIKSHISDPTQLVPFLRESLFLGKEAIYRRIRGEVPFTFEEMAIISLKLGFSIDSLAGLKQSDRAYFDAALYNHLSPNEMYYQLLADYFLFFKQIIAMPNAVSRLACNHLPYVFSIYLETLSKFRYYKWMHERMAIDPNCAMEACVVPAQIRTIQKEWVALQDRQTIPSTYFFDNNLFATICRDISFFRMRNLLTDTEVKALESELLFLADSLEELARVGVTPTGSLIHFYILPFDIGANYMYFELGDNAACTTHIHSIDYLLSYNSHVCKLQKEHLEQLQRYALYITQSGEIMRLAYFKKQREYIIKMGFESAKETISQLIKV